jgi:hypothetical protein
MAAHLYIRFFNAGRPILVNRDIVEFSTVREITHQAVNKLLVTYFVLSCVYMILGVFLLVLFSFKYSERIYLYVGGFLVLVSVFTITFNEVTSFHNPKLDIV